MLLIFSFCLLLIFVKSSNCQMQNFNCFAQNGPNRRFSPAQLADTAFWHEQFQKIELTNSAEFKLKEFICELSQKQRIFEAVFGTLPRALLNVPPSMADEFEVIKSKREMLVHNDPALSEVLNGLFVTEMNAKQKLQLLPDVDAFLLVKTMRKHLSFVFLFLAKRYRIRLSDSKERIVLTEQSLNDFLEESFQLMSQAKKCISCENCANDRTKREGKNYSRTKRLLQFISKAIQIDWDGNGLLNRSKNSNRRRKRKRIMKIFEPITLAILLLFLVIFIIILCMLCQGAIISFRNGTAFGDGTNAAITEQSEQRDRKCLNAFKGISPVVLDRQKGDKHHEGEEDEQLECAICLGPIDYGTEVRPLPVCKHKFHDECIELWIRGGHNACPFCRQEIFNLQMMSPTLFPQHRQNNDRTNEATLIEITNGGGTEENEEGRREEEEGRRTTTAEGGEIDQV